MKIEAFEKSYNIVITSHLEHTRTGYSNPRGYNYQEEDIKDILECALRNGLTSFRNKGTVRLRYKDTEGCISFMLIALKADIITIITVLDTKHKRDDFMSYITVKNTIELVGQYTLEKRYELKLVKATPTTKAKGLRKVNNKKIKKSPHKEVTKEITQEEIDEFISALKG